jgi:hypothetical protein
MSQIAAADEGEVVMISKLRQIDRKTGVYNRCTMPQRPPLRRIIREHVKDNLCDEHWQDRMVAHVSRYEEKIGAFPWHDPKKGDWENPHWLKTPCGRLEVWANFKGCWTVNLDRGRLVHARSGLDVIFTSVAAAKAAGLFHVDDGFGNVRALKDGLRWKGFNFSPAERPVLALPDDFSVDQAIGDDHEWGRRRLKELLKSSGAGACATDDNLILDLEACARTWQLLPPPWIKRARGFFELTTPHGVLVVRRLIGWTVEKNGIPLVWFLSGERVIFDKLEHAKISALVHARDRGNAGLGYGISWGCTAGNRLAA